VMRTWAHSSRCFGAREVWSGDRRPRIGDAELLLLLGVHPVTGIQSEAVVERAVRGRAD
jgi:hypothetical protein